MKILVTGANGFLGKKLVEILSKSHVVYGTARNADSRRFTFLDICDRSEVFDVVRRISPDVIVHTAAACNANQCEITPDLSDRVNVNGTRNIKDACEREGIKLVFLSSDYVFDGLTSPYTEESPVNPVNHYGRAKLQSERIIEEHLRLFAIIRPGIMYGFNDENDKNTFLKYVLLCLRNDKTASADNEVIKYPVLIDDVAKFIQKIIEQDNTGIFNIGAEEGFTRFQLANRIADYFGLDKNLIQAEKGDDPAQKPHNVQYDLTKARTIGVPFHNLETGLNIFQHQESCIFRAMYSSLPSEYIMGQSVSDFRIRVGKTLAKEAPAEADIVISVPESGIFGATGYAEESGIPFHFGISTVNYSRTLREEKPEDRAAVVRKKLLAVPDLVKDKKIVVVDEAIVSGTTILEVIRHLKEAGAKEIHLRIPSPPMITKCNYGTVNSYADLIASKYVSDPKKLGCQSDLEESIKNELKVDSLRFLSYKGLEACIRTNIPACKECFGRYEK